MFLEPDTNQPGGIQFADAQTHDGNLKENKIPASYLGPATITGALQKSGVIDVRLPTGSYAKAVLAVAGFYRPNLGDKVLVIAHENTPAYVIGVIVGSGLNTWTVPGDLVIKAPEGGIQMECAGAMKLKSKQKVDIISPRLALRATRLELSARRMVQKVDDAYLWVKDLFQLKSRVSKTVADESFLVKTKRARMKSEGDFNINGKNINLG